MKDRTLAVISLVVSIGTLGYAAVVSHRADAAVAAGLAKREAQLVESWTPAVRLIARDVLGDTNIVPQQPRTLEDLSRPVQIAIERLGSLPTALTNKQH
jgi:hypothetical protein